MSEPVRYDLEREAQRNRYAAILVAAAEARAKRAAQRAMREAWTLARQVGRAVWTKAT